MPRTVAEIARAVHGRPLGRLGLEISELRALDETHPAAISPLFRKAALRVLPVLPGAVLADLDLAELALAAGVPAAVVHENPPAGLAAAVDLFHPPSAEPAGIHPTAYVDQAASVHATAWVGPLAVVEGGVVIGEGSAIGPGAVICAGTRIGRFVRVGPGAVIGADGFGFVPTENGPLKIRHVGRVSIADFAEIGANACIDRGTLGTTFVGEGAKLDNLVQVGHNARVGRNALIAGQTGLAGSTVVGDGAMLGGQVGVADHVTVGAEARVAAKSGVTRNVPDRETVAGYPAWPRRRWLRAMAWLAREARGGKADESED